MPTLRTTYPGWICAFACACGSLLFSPPSVATNDYGLPSLGAASTSVSNEEYRLGRAWLRQFRAQAPQWQDPITKDYLQSLIARLAPHSDINGLRTITVMVDNASLNAFAVPGGVVGINSGLFAFAEDEGAFVSVLAHELGHLSQRHYARGSARAAQTQLPAMAAMLAGMLIAASGGGDAGMAAAMGSQAALIQDQLSYSRLFEQEADNIGLQAMADAGYDPEAMVRMFSAMQRMARLQGDTPPEFLLTHPVTDNRLSAAQARAAQLNVADAYTSDTLYDMMRARALLSIYTNTPQQAASRLAQEGAEQAAQDYLAALIDARNGQTDSALEQLDRLANEHPDFAQLQRDPQAAYDLLRDITSQNLENPQVFNLLAEAAGRSGHDSWGHLARAEYLQLTGRVERGIRQLSIARDAAERENDQQALARIEQRREDFIEYREALDDFN